MSTNRSRRIDRDTAEQLLGGAVGDPSAGQDASLTGPDGGTGRLARVLAAAAAPASAAELAGEEAALTAFREALLTPDPVATTAPVRRRPMATAALARAFSTKAAAAVLGATALCGVAAAATGNLPSMLGGRPAGPDRAPVVGSSSGSSSSTGRETGGASSPSAHPSGTGSSGGGQAIGPSASASPGSPSAGGHGTATASPAQVALCRGFADRVAKGEVPRQLAADPQYAPLLGAASGPDQVEAFCDDALGHHGPTPQPHDSTRPSPGADPGSTTGGTGGGAGKGNGDGGAGKNGGSAGDGGGTKPGKGGAVPTALPDVHPSRQDQPTQR